MIKKYTSVSTSSNSGSENAYALPSLMSVDSVGAANPKVNRALTYVFEVALKETSVDVSSYWRLVSSMSGTFTVNQTMFWHAIAEWIISTGTIKDET
jgi:hypothetical protein